MDTAHLYDDVPGQQKSLLFDFRDRHGYKKIDADGASWRYISCGKGEKAVALLPGGFATADMWFYLVSSLEDRYRFIVPDSYSLQGTWGLDNVCNAIVAMLNAENTEKATFIGISAGGGVAQYFIQENHGRVAGLALSHCGPIVPHKPVDVLRFQAMLALIRLLPVSTVREIMLKRLSGKSPVPSEWAGFEKAYYNELAENLDKELLIRFMKDGIDERRHFVYKPDQISSWKGPALILSSKDDSLSFDKVELLKARFPRANVHIFEQGGHHTVTFFPEEYTEIVRKFLDEMK